MLNPAQHPRSPRRAVCARPRAAGASLWLSLLVGALALAGCEADPTVGGGEDATAADRGPPTDAAAVRDQGPGADQGAVTDGGPDPDGGPRRDEGPEPDRGMAGDAEDLDGQLADAGPGDDLAVPDLGPPPDLGPTPAVYVGAAPIYQPGPLPVRRVTLEAGQGGAPVPVTAWVPDAGEAAVPVVVFQHGFILSGAWYGEVLNHLASHGFLVVAPQMYAADNLPFGKPSSVEEAASAVTVLGWLGREAERAFGVRTDGEAPGLAGHSRGGKVIWTLMHGDAGRARAIAGLDPVDGTGGPLGGEARILEAGLTFETPALIIGAGLGGQSTGPFSPACAPVDDNHARFVAATPGPVWHGVAPAYGHNDLLDPNPPGCLICGLCPGGPTPADFRRYLSGQLTAFFRAQLQGDRAALDLLLDVDAAPVDATASAERAEGP